MSAVDPPPDLCRQPASLNHPPEYAPISLNHLIQEGVRQFQLELAFAQRGVEIELALAQNLHRILGEPSQLRRLFRCITNSLFKSTQPPNAAIRFETSNFEPHHHIDLLHSQHQHSQHQHSQHQHSQSAEGKIPEEKLLDPLSVSVAMGISVNWFTPIPVLDPQPTLITNHMQEDQANQAFAWTQIHEVIQLHRGTFSSTHPTATTTSIQLIFPAIRGLH